MVSSYLTVEFLVPGGFDIKNSETVLYLIVQTGFRQKSRRYQRRLHLLWLSAARENPQGLTGLRESCCSCGQVNKSDGGKQHRDRRITVGSNGDFHFPIGSREELLLT